MSGPRDRPDWLDVEDEHAARAAWSRLTEPGDRAAGRYVHELGPGPALLALVEGRAPARQAARWRVRLDEVDPRRDARALSRVGGRLLVPGDPQWPAGLDQLGDRRPFCLWVRGPLPPAGSTGRAVAIVGARASTPYGEHVAAGLGAGVAARGVCVVSGAAYGIDAAAHRGALGAGGQTVAVLACGIDRCYPRGNERLVGRIAVAGAVVSELPPGASPTRWRFLQRNRLIAAITGASVVVEAAWRSGAATTAREAAEVGRPVAAVPGPVTSAASAGCHVLLRDGAVCVTDAGEVVELVSSAGQGLARRPAGPPADHDDLDPEGIIVLDAVPLGRPAGEAAIARCAGLDPATVRGCLGRLELRGLVERGGDGGWRRRRPARPAPARPASIGPASIGPAPARDGPGGAQGGAGA